MCKTDYLALEILIHKNEAVTLRVLSCATPDCSIWLDAIWQVAAALRRPGASCGGSSLSGGGCAAGSPASRSGGGGGAASPMRNNNSSSRGVSAAAAGTAPCDGTAALQLLDAENARLVEKLAEARRTASQANARIKELEVWLGAQ